MTMKNKKYGIGITETEYGAVKELGHQKISSQPADDVRRVMVCDAIVWMGLCEPDQKWFHFDDIAERQGDYYRLVYMDIAREGYKELTERLLTELDSTSAT